MNRKEWLEKRRRCIGASDAAAVLGESPWKSQYALWAEKVHGIDTVEETQRMKWGLALEPAIAEEFDLWARENIEAYSHLIDPGQYEMQRHCQHSFIAATLDREVWDNYSRVGVLEIKTADGRNAGDWADEPPLYYQIQVQHQLLVTGLPMGWLAVLIGGNDFRVYTCPRNESFIARLLERELAFWRLVETETPPEIDGSTSTTQAIRLLHPQDSGAEIVLDEDVWLDDILYLDELKEKVKEYQAEITVIENRLKNVIADATYAHCGAFTFSYKTQTRKAHEVKESTCRVLRRGKRKEKK